jgi:hypothetical protein
LTGILALQQILCRPQACVAVPGSPSRQASEPEPLREERPGASRCLLILSCSHQLLFEGAPVDDSMLQQCPLPIHIRAHRNDLSPSLLSYRGIPFHELSKPSDWIDVYTYLQPALLQRLMEETRTWKRPPQLHPERAERRTGAGGSER